MSTDNGFSAIAPDEYFYSSQFTDAAYVLRSGLRTIENINNDRDRQIQDIRNNSNLSDRNKEVLIRGVEEYARNSADLRTQYDEFEKNDPGVIDRMLDNLDKFEEHIDDPEKAKALEASLQGLVENGVAPEGELGEIITDLNKNFGAILGEDYISATSQSEADALGDGSKQRPDFEMESILNLEKFKDPNIRNEDGTVTMVPQGISVEEFKAEMERNPRARDAFLAQTVVDNVATNGLRQESDPQVADPIMTSSEQVGAKSLLVPAGGGVEQVIKADVVTGFSTFTEPNDNGENPDGPSRAQIDSPLRTLLDARDVNSVAPNGESISRLTRYQEYKTGRVFEGVEEKGYRITDTYVMSESVADEIAADLRNSQEVGVSPETQPTGQNLTLKVADERLVSTMDMQNALEQARGVDLKGKIEEVSGESSTIGTGTPTPTVEEVRDELEGKISPTVETDSPTNDPNKNVGEQRDNEQRR